MDCLFCNIVSGNTPSYIVYEDKVVSVFLDAFPDSVGHILIVPKKHIYDLNDMDDLTWTHLLGIAKMMCKKIEDTLHPDGITLIQNNGVPQVIKHFHLHLKPFYKEEKEMDKETVYELLTKKSA